jgi:transposase
MEKAHQVLTNEQFEMIAKFFPKPRKPESITLRRCINAIFYVLKEWCSWRWLPYEFREKEWDWHTIYTRYKRWSESWLLGKILRELEVNDFLRVRIAFLDSTSIRAHQCASWALKKRVLKQFEDQKVV